MDKSNPLLSQVAVNQGPLYLTSVKKGVEAAERGESVGGEECEMGDSDNSDSDVIGPPLPPGYSANTADKDAGPSHSQQDVSAGEGDSEDEGGDDDSVSVTISKLFFSLEMSGMLFSGKILPTKITS